MRFVDLPRKLVSLFFVFTAFQMIGSASHHRARSRYCRDVGLTQQGNDRFLNLNWSDRSNSRLRLGEPVSAWYMENPEGLTVLNERGTQQEGLSIVFQASQPQQPSYFVCQKRGPNGRGIEKKLIVEIPGGYVLERNNAVIGFGFKCLVYSLNDASQQRSSGGAVHPITFEQLLEGNGRSGARRNTNPEPDPRLQNIGNVVLDLNNENRFCLRVSKNGGVEENILLDIGVPKQAECAELGGDRLLIRDAHTADSQNDHRSTLEEVCIHKSGTEPSGNGRVPATRWKLVSIRDAGWESYSDYLVVLPHFSKSFADGRRGVPNIFEQCLIFPLRANDVFQSCGGCGQSCVGSSSTSGNKNFSGLVISAGFDDRFFPEPIPTGSVFTAYQRSYLVTRSPLDLMVYKINKSSACFIKGEDGFVAGYPGLPAKAHLYDGDSRLTRGGNNILHLDAGHQRGGVRVTQNFRSEAFSSAVLDTFKSSNGSSEGLNLGTSEGRGLSCFVLAISDQQSSDDNYLLFAMMPDLGKGICVALEPVCKNLTQDFVAVGDFVKEEEEIDSDQQGLIPFSELRAPIYYLDGLFPASGNEPDTVGFESCGSYLDRLMGSAAGMGIKWFGRFKLLGFITAGLATAGGFAWWLRKSRIFRSFNVFLGRKFGPVTSWIDRLTGSGDQPGTASAAEADREEAGEQPRESGGLIGWFRKTYHKICTRLEGDNRSADEA